MQVLCAHNVPNRTRGLITRYFMEVSPGVYVGGLSRPVVERLWSKLESLEYYGRGHVLLIEPAKTPQGFRVREAGSGSKSLVLIDSFWFLRRGRGF